MEYVIILILLVISLFIVWYLTVEKKESEEKINNIIRGTNSFILETFNRSKKRIRKKFSKSYLTSYNWILTNELNDDILFTFKNNLELLITTNGTVKRAEYELITNNNCILITKDNLTEHYDILYIENDFLFLNKVSTDSILFFANKARFKDEIKLEVNKKAKEIYNLT
jgi:hypothetical protein